MERILKYTKWLCLLKIFNRIDFMDLGKGALNLNGF